MITGTTSTGFAYTIDERRAKSWSLVKKIAKMQQAENDIQIYSLAIDLIGDIIGEEQEARLVQHVTALYGYDDAETVSKEVFEIIGAARRAPELKNSASSPDVSEPTRMPSSAISQRPMESMTTQPFPSSSSRPFAPASGTTVG